MDIYTQIEEARDFIQSKTRHFIPETGIVLGTGLGQLIDQVDIICSIDYGMIPYFPISTVEMHEGRLIFAMFGKVSVVIMQGRFHYYEGYNTKEITFPIRVLQALGIKQLFISNISGGINNTYQLGDLMILKDHINLLPENPLRGQNIETLGPRYPDMSVPYDSVLMNEALSIAQKYNYRAHLGVYASVQGPCLETPAEYRYLSIIGSDAVGMSTVPEVIVARHMGIPVLAISIITDLCFPPMLKKVDINEIIDTAQGGQPKLTTIFRSILENQKRNE